MPSTIITKNGSGAPLAADLVAGELAVDLTNGRLYTEDTGGSVIEIGLNPSGNVDVTGTVTADGLTVDGASTINSLLTIDDSSPRFYLMESDTTDLNAQIRVQGGVLDIRTINDALSAATSRFSIDNATGDISFYEDTGTTAKLFWDASAESLAIGTTSPASLLHIENSAGGSGGYAKFTDVTHGGDVRFGMADGVDNNAISGAFSNNDYLFYTNSLERMRIDSSGNVGIGESDPVQKLHISGASGSARMSLGRTNTNTTGGVGSLQWNALDGHAVAGIIAYGDGDDEGANLVFNTTSAASSSDVYVSTTERMRIDSAGNLTLSTSKNANNILLIQNDDTSTASYATQSYLKLSVGGDSVGGLKTTAKNLGGLSTKALYLVTEGNYPIAFGLNASPTPSMLLDENGNLLVGTTSGSFNAKITAESGSSYTFESRRTGTGSEGHVVFRNANGAVGSIFTDGTSTAYNTTSDYRLKENVVAMSGATERLKQLNPSRFNFIADPDKTVDGFLAHEVQDIVPEAVTGTKDAVDAEGNPEYQGIDQSKLVPLLVATIQELEARIAQLEGAN
jgi:hypothetical protein